MPIIDRGRGVLLLIANPSVVFSNFDANVMSLISNSLASTFTLKNYEWEFTTSSSEVKAVVSKTITDGLLS